MSSEQLERLVEGISGFTEWKHAQRIRLFAWYLHRHENKARFETGDVRRLYGALALAEPGNYTQQLTNLREAKVLLKDRAGFYLEKRVRDEFDEKYGQRPTRIAVHALLASLPARVPNVAERVFLEEAIKCFSVEAFRAAIVMAWNLAYDHVCTYVLARHLDAFNRQWPVSLPKHHEKARIKQVTKMDDFSEFKESEVIQVCKAAAIVPGEVAKVLSAKLDRRNTAAHPSDVVVTALTAEEFISDLGNNVVLKLAV